MYSLNEVLTHTIERSKQIYNAAYRSFVIMYNTGIRHDELNADKLFLNSNNKIVVISSKNSNIRYLSTSEVQEECIQYISELNQYNTLKNRSTLTNYFLKSSYPYRLTHLNSSLFLHSFRHNYIKSKMEVLNDIEKLKVVTGHKSNENVLKYVNSNITINQV